MDVLCALCPPSERGGVKSQSHTKSMVCLKSSIDWFFGESIMTRRVLLLAAGNRMTRTCDKQTMAFNQRELLTLRRLHTEYWLAQLCTVANHNREIRPRDRGQPITVFLCELSFQESSRDKLFPECMRHASAFGSIAI